MADASETSKQAGQLLRNIGNIDIVEIALIVLGTWGAIYLARRLLPYLAERGPSRTRIALLAAVPIARLGLLALAIGWIVPLIFHVTFQNFLVIAGAASVAIGFAFKDYVSSLIAGIVAVVERPYRAGDWVTLGDHTGEVVHVGLRALQINTADDNNVTVPHATLWTDAVVNGNDGARTLQCVAEFYVAPDHDANVVREALRDVALTSAYLEYDTPIVVVLSETPWATHYKIRAYPFDLRDQFLFVSDMTARSKQALAAAGARQVSAPASVEQAA